MSASKPAAIRCKTRHGVQCSESPFQIVDDFRAWATRNGLDCATRERYIHESRGHGFDYMRASLLCVQQSYQSAQ